MSVRTELPDLELSREVVSLRQRVTDKLRETILAGGFAPGQRLVERDLWQSLGISRTVLREALQHLQAEGLITMVPHKGPVVARLSADEARELYEVRGALEALAGSGFARNASDDQLGRLRQALDFLRTPEASATTEGLLAAKNAFYAILLEGCGNRVIGQMLTQLNNRVTLLRRLSLGKPGRLSNTLEELEAVVQAIEARDAELAGRLCAAHVARAAEVVRRSFEEISA
ncbi:MAG TPA: GntR family transcriptional regulator [Burkholderiaceae bacterium]|nr:GntR family transcriptional regulator [Burkholderiaceae bacterium]